MAPGARSRTSVGQGRWSSGRWSTWAMGRCRPTAGHPPRAQRRRAMRPPPTTADRSGGTCPRRPRSTARPSRIKTRRNLRMAADGKIEALRSVSLFSDLRQRDLEQVAQLADEVDLPAGHVLMREGENGSQMFIIGSGEARVEHAGREIAVLGPGAVLGEMALGAEGPRVAT